MAADRSGASQRERPLPFGLQLLLAAGIILLILGVARQVTVVPARQELDAVRALRNLRCEFEWRDPADEIKTLFGTYRRSWFTWILGENYFSSIVRFRIRRSESDDLLRHIAQLRDYGEAIALLRGTGTTDAGVNRLAGVPRLRVADLALTQITDTGVKHLAAASDLEVLDLEHTRVTDEAVASLATMPKLRELNLEGTFVSDLAVRRLKAAKPELSVTWATAPSEAELAVAAELAAVPGLAVRAMRCESGATAYAAALQWSRFWPRSIPPPPTVKVQTGADVLKQLGRLPHLVRLKVYGSSLAKQDLDDLARLKTVRELYLRDCSFIFPGVAERFAGLTNLRKLVVVRAPLSGRELELICSLPRLEVLVLQWPQPYYRSSDDFWSRSELVAINDDGLECLRRMPHLRKLVLRTPERREWHPAKLGEISDAGLAYIRALPNLEYLDLSGTKITPAGLLGLQGMAKLRELVILGVPINAEQEAKLRRALPKATIRTGPLDQTESGRLPQPPPNSQKSLAELLREPDPIP